MFRILAVTCLLTRQTLRLIGASLSEPRLSYCAKSSLYKRMLVRTASNLVPRWAPLKRATGQ